MPTEAKETLVSKLNIDFEITKRERKIKGKLIRLVNETKVIH
jgi:hypothetical protein